MSMSSHQMGFVVLALLTAGCSCPCSKPAKSSEAKAIAPSYPVITRLVSRNQTVTISAGPASALYSVQSADGKVLVAFATLDELREKHPEQYRFLQPVV